MVLSSYDCIVMGISAGGMEVLRKLLPSFPASFSLPIIVVQHLHPNQGEFYIKYFNDCCKMQVKEAEENEPLRPGIIYFAPPNYHLLIEQEKTFSLSIDPKVNFSRPSIDELFFSAADVFGNKLVGVIMTGANDDGARGMRYIKQQGGYTIAQDPDTAEVFTMPKAAIEITEIDEILSVDQIIDLFRSSNND